LILELLQREGLVIRPYNSVQIVLIPLFRLNRGF
jgi:hypothetical protein